MKRFLVLNLTFVLTLITFIPLANGSDAEKDYQNGRNLYETKQYYLAAVSLRAAAFAGHTGAAYLLAQMYKNGDGVVKDEKEYMKWLSVATGSANAPTALPVSSTDAFSKVEVSILNVFSGEEVVRQHRMYDHQLRDLRGRGRNLIYFEFSVKNKSVNPLLTVYSKEFRLEDTEGNLYTYELTKDSIIQGLELHVGKSTRGGVAFAIYPDSIPEKLLFNTGLRSPSGQKIIVEVKGLSRLTGIGHDNVVSTSDTR